jgi:hypothetical protein
LGDVDLRRYSQFEFRTEHPHRTVFKAVKCQCDARRMDQYHGNLHAGAAILDEHIPALAEGLCAIQIAAYLQLKDEFNFANPIVAFGSAVKECFLHPDLKANKNLDRTALFFSTVNEPLFTDAHLAGLSPALRKMLYLDEGHLLCHEHQGTLARWSVEREKQLTGNGVSSPFYRVPADVVENIGATSDFVMMAICGLNLEQFQKEVMRVRH